MDIYIGLSEKDLIARRLETPVFYNPSNLLNAHLLLSGMSGSGKSTQANNLLQGAINSGVEVDLFDTHDEFADIAGASVCLFSQSTGFGNNPLELDVNEHTGGMNAQINFFLRLIKEVTSQFGVKQEGVLRNLLADTYAMYGITQDDQSSWHRKQITEAGRLSLLGNNDPTLFTDYYPTLEDLKALAKEKIIALTVGGDRKCVTAFNALTRLRKKLDKLKRELEQEVDDTEIAKLESQIGEQSTKCIAAYTTFINSMGTGNEIEDVLKYDSTDVLTGVLQRIILLGSTGILSANPPPFGRSRVRVHQIMSLDHEQQVLYVKLRLQNIFEESKKQGMVRPGSPPRRIVYIEEAHRYFSNDSGDIINILAKEARKFGIGLWCSSQQPTSFPDSYLTNVGATILLGIHTSYWKKAAAMWRIKEDDLLRVKPKEIMSVKFLLDGKVDPPFLNIIVPNPNNQLGMKALEFAEKGVGNG